MGSSGLLKRMMHSLASDAADLHAEQLQQSAEELGATPVARCGNRQREKVAGTLRTVTLRPRAGVPALEAELWDGSGAVSLVWLGRRQIVGIEPGRRLMAHGRMATVSGRRLMFNPFYDLLPPDC